MSDKDEQLRELFLAEASDQYDELNTLITRLEKNHKDREVIEAIFRITHTLKANAAAMGFDAIGKLSHLLEDIFSVLKKEEMTMTSSLCDTLFKAIDKIGELLEGIRTGQKVSYRGLQVRLKVILEKNNNPHKFIPTTTTKEETNVASQKEEKDEKRKEEITDVKQEEKPPKVEEKKISSPSKEVKKEAHPTASLPQDSGTNHNMALSDRIQVPIDKLDVLMNLVSELAIEKDRIITNSNRLGRNEFTRLYRITSDLQYSVMGVRLVQIDVLFHKFHRIVRDVAALEHKEVELVLEGTDIEIDRNVLQTISDSMIHLVRNAVSHGIEDEVDRQKSGKQETARITLRARNEKEYVAIDVEDNGKGINPEVIRRKAIEKQLDPPEYVGMLSDKDVIKYIFEPGFSSADKVTAVSGRGVGMDVVKKGVESIGGKVFIHSELGKGTKFTLLLPSSMAVKNALLFIVNDAEFAIPLSYTEAVTSVERKQIYKVANGLMTLYQDRTIPVIFLDDLFSCEKKEQLYHKKLMHQSFDQSTEVISLNVIVVAVEDTFVGLVVDKLLQQKEIIEKPLSKPLDTVPFVSGATILGSGNVCLVLDIPDITDFLLKPKLKMTAVV
ncbi:chemotaxis protein CheA [Algivirga pacifica]|uniref:Chemotaxis protein CheA n=1 Tax=Algivirga pacifica TaxID=1162670 RepID=A0ABP9DNC4_9BACT